MQVSRNYKGGTSCRSGQITRDEQHAGQSKLQGYSACRSILVMNSIHFEVLVLCSITRNLKNQNLSLISSLSKFFLSACRFFFDITIDEFQLFHCNYLYP